MSPRVVVWLALAGATLSCPPLVHAQPLPGPPIVVGMLVAISCPGSLDGIPAPYLACDRGSEGAPGPYVRPYLSIRPVDRLVVTVQGGAISMPGYQEPVWGVGHASPGLLIRPARTAWHVHGSAAYLGGEPTHPVRAFVGGGLSYFDDPVRNEFRPALPPGANDGLSWRTRSGWNRVLVAGVLFRVTRRLEGRASYMLAGQLTTPAWSDDVWRHEIGVGLGWRVR